MIERYPSLIINDLTQDGMTFSMEDDIEFSVIETPGHSPDHLSFSMSQKDYRCVFAGDTILPTPSVGFVNLKDYM